MGWHYGTDSSEKQKNAKEYKSTQFLQHLHRGQRALGRETPGDDEHRLILLPLLQQKGVRHKDSGEEEMVERKHVFQMTPRVKSPI